jgi:aryl-alcohol dehydrogenase-like predicted oxidoreductase
MNFKNMFGEIGFGCMKASFNMDASNRESTIEALHTALDNGVRFFDTADIYAPSWNTFGHNEQLVAEALHAYSGNKDGLIVATKGGISRKPGEVWGRNASLDYLLRAAEASAGRLGVGQLDVWQHHRLDPSIRFETQLENLAGLQQRGIAKHIGVSNYSAKQLRRAVEVLGEVVSVQNQLNPIYRQELDVLEVCEELGIAYLPWSPMKGARDVAILAEIGAEVGESPYAVAVAWLRSLSPQMVVMPGVTRSASVNDALRGVALTLSAEQLGRIEAGLPQTLPMDAELLGDLPKE